MLPSTVSLERNDIGAAGNDPYLIAMRQAVQPFACSRHDFDALGDIASELGVGDVFTAWQSADGSAWTRVGSSRVIGMQPSVHVGLAVCSHDNARTTSMTASGFRVRPLSALLVANSTMLGSGDAAVKRRLEALGFAGFTFRAA